MQHETLLIATVAVCFGVAFVFGMIAMRLRLPPLVGYLLAGVVIGPFTPGYVADAGLAQQFAEFGVIILMFGVGLHFSLRDLAAVRRIAVPGALLQAGITGTVGSAIGFAWGWGAGGAAVLGLSLAVASTVVLLKSLERRDLLDSAEGQLAVGWLVVEDLAMVFALVLLPAIAPMLLAEGPAAPLQLLRPVAIALAKVVVFLALMFFVGRRFVPWLLERVAGMESRELFTLSVIALALGIGTIAARLFGVSFALGAFFAGAVISESELSHRAAAEALPMQDAFAVLFFVSVGMLFDPSGFVTHPWRLVALVALVVVWKSLAAFGVLRVLGASRRTALVVGPSLGQIGEFSFIVLALGMSLGLITAEMQATVVAAALVAITVNGPVVSLTSRIANRRAQAKAAEKVARRTRELRVSGDDLAPADATTPALGKEPSAELQEPYDFSDLRGHVVLVGFGRVGATVAEALTRAGSGFVVVEEQERIVGGLRLRGERAIQGDATRADVLARAGIAGASLLVVTAPEPFRARRIVQVARAVNASLAVAVRTHSAAEQAFFEEYLGARGSGRAVYAEREAALSLAHYALTVLGRSDDEADWVIATLRGQPTRPTETFSALGPQEFQALMRREGPAQQEPARRSE
ncbi:MAG: cation:proton antiporter domain-containing protein [Gemmatimonadaceae bacterium]